MSETKKIAVIDDDDDLLHTLAMLLEEWGYAIEPHSSAEAALVALRQGARPDLILLDLMMPTMNGWEFLEHQRADPTISAIPVVVMSASRSFDPGALSVHAVIHKPFDIDHLQRTLEGAANGAAAVP